LAPDDRSGESVNDKLTSRHGVARHANMGRRRAYPSRSRLIPTIQTFAIAIQLGVIGTLALRATWIAHFLLFRRGGITAWLRTVTVVDNVVCSTVHSHLFDFNNGWLYVLGVGVLGGNDITG